MSYTLSILIPVYNEQAYLEKLVERVLAAPVPEGFVKEIVIVNDASTDGTQTVIDRLVAANPQIRAFCQPVNCGKGAAIRRAVQEMTGDLCIIQDADLEYDPNEYPVVLKPLLEAGADVVYGSRFANREMRKVLFYHHKLGNLLLTHLSNWTTGLDLTDMETCYKAFRADLLKTIPIRSNRFGIEPEITAKIAKRNFTVYEVPISYHGRQYSEGKKIGWKDGVSAVYTIFKYWLIDDCYTAESGKTVLTRTDQARTFTQWLAAKMSPHLGSNILEIGAGIGHLSKFLPQKTHLTLSDRADEHVQWLKTVYHGNAVVSVESLDIESDTRVTELCEQQPKFDTIVLFRQLEKTENDVETLERIRRLLQPNGVLVLVVPLHPEFSCIQDRQSGQKRRYTTQEICQKLETAGFTVEHSEPFHFLGYLGYQWNRLWRRTKPLGKIQLKIYNTLVPFFAVMERILPCGSADMMIVAKNTPRFRKK